MKNKITCGFFFNLIQLKLLCLNFLKAASNQKLTTIISTNVSPPTLSSFYFLLIENMNKRVSWFLLCAPRMQIFIMHSRITIRLKAGWKQHHVYHYMDELERRFLWYWFRTITNLNYQAPTEKRIKFAIWNVWTRKLPSLCIHGPPDIFWILFWKQ